MKLLAGKSIKRALEVSPREDKLPQESLDYGEISGSHSTSWNLSVYPKRIFYKRDSYDEVAFKRLVKPVDVHARFLCAKSFRKCELAHENAAITSDVIKSQYKSIFRKETRGSSLLCAIIVYTVVCRVCKFRKSTTYVLHIFQLQTMCRLHYRQ